MGKRTCLISFFIIVLLATIGCSQEIIINKDGMPVSDHEYQLTNTETKVRAVVVLARYYAEDEGDGEWITKPEYLDALRFNKVDSDATKSLIFHIKIINTNKQYYSLGWEIKGPEKSDQMTGLLYSGKLSRKDFYIKLPLNKPGQVTYSLSVLDADGDDLFDLPLMRYKVKGGAEGNMQSNF